MFKYTLDNKRYHTLNYFYKNKFGCKVFKVSLNAGFSCPNRDGSIGKGGCIYCNNASFSPSYCSDTANRQSQEEMLNLEADNIRRQLRRGKQFFDRKYPDMKYIAYFQSFTNTYGPVEKLRKLYTEALESPQIIGLSIGTGVAAAQSIGAQDHQRVYRVVHTTLPAAILFLRLKLRIPGF